MAKIFSHGKVSGYTKLPTNFFAFLILFFLHHHFTIFANSYTPAENFAVNCGSSGPSPAPLGNRIWTGDVDSKIFSPIESQNNQKSTTSSTSPLSSPSVPFIPYGTARLSFSDFTYSFPVTDGQKFIRLHFYPASYSNFSRFNSFFSVKSGPYTLLKDFNASLIADNDHRTIDGTVSREYCINVEPGQRLNITFIPNNDHLDAYAFINGIEIVSMPTNLYYTKPESPDDQGLQLVGHENNYHRIGNKTALATLYRINVGGKQIPAEGDTGMFRYWDDDINYVEQQKALSVPVGYGLKPNYKDDQENYAAPDYVYMTARTYGMKEKSRYNVTWDFQVDSEFIYMVRLHFCEFEQEIQKTGERVFQIFIDDLMAEPHADVIMWSGGSLIPYHKDYAVILKTGSLLKKVNVSIKLQPHPDPRVSDYDNVILNGIEIFKVSDNDNLGEANPIQAPSLPAPLPKKSKKTTMVIPIAVGAASGFIVLSIIGFLIFRKMTRPPVSDGHSRWGKSHFTANKSSNKTQESSLPSDLCRYFTIAEIRAATNNFDDIFIFGVGGFGNVYKGYIDDGTRPVAIKRLKPGSQQGAHEFRTEIEMLSQLRHLHLVSLIGYCDDGNEMILVYDFMARGTLRDHLYDSDNQPLSWKQRLEICLGAARGLHYLHTGAKHNIIHRDVKSTNILLDEKWVAKVSDFGLSKIGPTGLSKTHISTLVKGSFGYLDPEYYKRQRLTEKSDVYSFGVVLLEVLCGRPPLLRNVDKKEANLVDWVQNCYQKGDIDRIVDPVLKGTVAAESVKKLIEMALNCLLEDGNQRPSMSDVVWGLEFALQLQGSLGENNELSGAVVERKSKQTTKLLARNVNDEEESDVQFTSVDGSVIESNSSKVTLTSLSSEEQALASRMVFSELWDPRAR